MKKLIALLSIAGMLSFGMVNTVIAQDTTQAGTTQVDSAAQAQTTAAPEATPAPESQTFHQVLKEKFIQGGAGWMTPILIVLIIGLALVIERIIYLNMSSTDTRKLLNKIESALETQGVGSC